MMEYAARSILVWNYSGLQVKLIPEASFRAFMIGIGKILAEQTEDMLIGISGILIVLTLLYHFTKSNSLYHDVTVLVYKSSQKILGLQN